MTDQALVTVVIPSYNAGNYLRPAVESILNQTYKNFELLVIDDGSTDDSMDTLSGIVDARLQVIRRSNFGKPATLNYAINLMRGEYLVVQDADDLSYPTRLADMVECMQTYPHVGMIFSGYDLIVNGRHMSPTFSGLSEDACKRLISQFKMPGHDPTSMTRASIAKEFLYNPDLRVGEGLDFILRVGERYPMMRLGKCLYSYRLSVSSLTRSNVERRKRYVRSVIRNAYQRRQMAIPPEMAESRDDVVCKTVTGADYDNNIAAQFMESVIDQRRSGQILAAIKTGFQCSAMHPFVFHYHKSLIYALLPLGVIDRIRARNR